MAQKERRNSSTAVLEEESKSERFVDVINLLEDLKKQEKKLDIQICPKCGSPRVIRVGTMGGDLWGHMGTIPVKFICLDCGWSNRFNLFATNKPDGVKEVELIAEAIALSRKESGDEK